MSEVSTAASPDDDTLVEVGGASELLPDLRGQADNICIMQDRQYIRYIFGEIKHLAEIEKLQTGSVYCRCVSREAAACIDVRTVTEKIIR